MTFIDDQEKQLRGIEAEIAKEVETAKNFAISRMEKLGPDASDAEYEAALGALNDQLAAAIGSVMFRRQKEITGLLKQFPGSVKVPTLTPEQLMQVTVQDETLADNFRRASPSRWMRNLFGQGRKAIEAQVESIIAGAVWGITADLTMRVLPTVEAWRWITERDEKVCELCTPLDGMVMTRTELQLLWPRHIGCRCQSYPEQTG